MVPNFAAIGRTFAEIWPFLIFQDGGRRHLGFLKRQLLMGGLVKRVALRHRAKFCLNHS